MKKQLTISIDTDLLGIIQANKPHYVGTNSFITFLLSLLITDKTIKKHVNESLKQQSFEF